MGITSALWPSEDAVLFYELMDHIIKTLVIPSVSIEESSHPIFDSFGELLDRGSGSL